jgi:hypothetical protein
VRSEVGSFVAYPIHSPADVRFIMKNITYRNHHHLHWFVRRNTHTQSSYKHIHDACTYISHVVCLTGHRRVATSGTTPMVPPPTSSPQCGQPTCPTTLPERRIVCRYANCYAPRNHIISENLHWRLANRSPYMSGTHFEWQHPSALLYLFRQPVWIWTF